MCVKKILRWVMLLSGGVTVCNLIAFYFLPVIFPTANFSIIRLIFIAIAEKKYGYILISCILTTLILMGAISIKENHIALQFLGFAVFLGDLIYGGCLFVDGLTDGFINMVVIWSVIIDIVVVTLFVIYLTGRIKNIKQNMQAMNMTHGEKRGEILVLYSNAHTKMLESNGQWITCIEYLHG